MRSLALDDPGFEDQTLTLIEQFVRDQQTLTPVARFAEHHERFPAETGFFRDRVPLSRPGPGQQYAFEVNLDLCSGCKACVTACHNLNGLDEDETWRSVGVLQGASSTHSITTSCHHCVDPGCLSGCPVKAYDKDPETGIVRHLDDQCIGCQYCILKCPYEVPKYNLARGIVRKCDMCSSRLAVGEAPACVQGCPNEAIRIEIIDTEELLAKARGEGLDFLATAPDPRITVPTTRYITQRAVEPGQMKKEALRASDSHLPLVVMLALTQLSVGGFTAALAAIHKTSETEQRVLILASFIAGIAGLLSSIFHLGRPLLAWKAVLNLRTSWMSREILLFAVFAIVATIELALHLAPAGTFIGPKETFLWLTVLSGMAAVFSSVMIYHDTHRSFWHFRNTAGRFFGSVLVLGSSLATVLSQSDLLMTKAALLLLVGSGTKLCWEWALLSEPPMQTAAEARSAALMKGPLRRFTVARFLFGALGGILCPFLILGHADAQSISVLASAAFLFCGAGELLERFLFFTAASPDRMPGQGVP
jgi:formate dehydrogenase iron-sulfur subunit